VRATAERITRFTAVYICAAIILQWGRGPRLSPRGVLQKYDLPDIVAALKRRAVVLLNPVDQLGRPLHK